MPESIAPMNDDVTPVGTPAAPPNATPVAGPIADAVRDDPKSAAKLNIAVTPAPRSGKMFTPDKYSSYEEYSNAWKNTKHYLSLPSSTRIRSFDSLRKRWDAAQVDKQAQAKFAQEHQPDTMGKLNEAAGSAVEKGVSSIDPSGVAGPIAGGITRAILPNSNIQAGIDAALFLAGGPEIKYIGDMIKFAPEVLKPAARLVTRLGITGLGGAAGGATEGKPGAGFEEGVKQQAMGEGAAGLLGVGKRTIAKFDVSRIGEWLDSRLGTKIKNISQLKTEMVHGNAVRRAEQQFANINKTIKRVIKAKGGPSSTGTFRVILPKEVTDSPAFQKIMGNKNPPLYLDYDETMKALDAVDQLGWDSRFRMTEAHGAAAMRSASHQIEEDVSQSIDAIDRKAGQAWYTARGKLRSARALTNLFQEKGVIEGDRLVMPEIQRLVTDAGPQGYGTDLRQSIGNAPMENFNNMLHRGGTPGKEDVIGQGPVKRVYAHLRGFSAATEKPMMARHVGHVPYNLGRGRALSALIVLGPHELANKLAHMFGASDYENSNATDKQQ